MTNNHAYTLKIDSPQITPQSPNFSPQTWPPEEDFPIIVNIDGTVISRMNDSIWNLTPWCDRVLSINFGDGDIRKGSNPISKENADILRIITAWWLYGPNRSITARGLARLCEILKPIFIFCSSINIKATDLSKFPRVVEELHKHLAPSSASYAITLLHDLWEQRASLGLEILDPSSLEILSHTISKHEKLQTPYIPPRIWLYQVNRLRFCLEEFNTLSKNFEECFHFCLNAYSHNAGSLADACINNLPAARRPFYTSNAKLNGKINSAKYYGNFSETAMRFGVDETLSYWIPSYKNSGAAALSSYFSLISVAGAAYLLNFSMMRHEEVFSLKSDCLIVERDPVTGEDIYLLKGETSKTIQDDEAFWITSPSVKVALDAMRVVAKLRIIAAEANPNVPTTPTDLTNPVLFLRAYEPWRRRSENLDTPITTKLARQHYESYLNRYPALFEEEEIRITEDDIKIARLMNPTLDHEKYDVGLPWNFSWHQLRRTGAVNMTASGLVGDSAVQYQLKHSASAMTRYYAQGYFNLSVNLNQEARTEYIKTMYEMLAKEFILLQSSRFISPHGDKRKSQILNLIDEKDFSQLIKASKNGKISFRQNFLGGCTYNGYCQYGGVDNIARCGGGDGKAPCEDVLYDRDKIHLIQALSENITSRLAVAPKDTPLERSLLAQKSATENALYALKSI